MIAVVLVGGEGTRLRPLTLDEPKPVLPIGGVPFIALLLDRRRADPCRGLFERAIAQRILGWSQLPELDLN